MSDQQSRQMYRENGHEFEVVKQVGDGSELLRCRNCLSRDVLGADDDPDDYLGLMTTDCHIEWLREPDGRFHGVAIRNASHFSGRELIGVKEDDAVGRVVDNVRVYDDDAGQLAWLLDPANWEDAQR